MKTRPMPAHRLERLLAIVRLLAAEPGLRRYQLAGRFGISERQIQDDLRDIGRRTYRCEARVALVRDRGYRLELRSLGVHGPGGAP